MDANVLDVQLFWGPEEALKFIRECRAVSEPEGWLDTVWCEGAAVVDLDRKLLLFFGGEGISFDVPVRRAYFELMSRTWPGWELRWAFEGILSVADYLGIPRERFRTTPQLPEQFDTLVSIADPQGSVRVAQLEEGPYILGGGPAGIDKFSSKCRAGPIRWDGEFPQGGVHLDLRQRVLSTWWTHDTPDLPSLTAEAWSEWTVRWWHDEYERQLELLPGVVELPILDLPSRRREVLQHLDRLAGRGVGDPRIKREGLRGLARSLGLET